MLKISAKLNGADDLIKKLYNIAYYNNFASERVVNEMATPTMDVAIANTPTNYGELRENTQLEINATFNQATATIFNATDYAKYVEFGTSGWWYVHKDDPNINLLKMSKYSHQKYWFNTLRDESGKPIYHRGQPIKIWMGYEMHGQEGKHFFRNAFSTTLQSNLDIARNIYLDEITRGI